MAKEKAARLKAKKEKKAAETRKREQRDRDRARDKNGKNDKSGKNKDGGSRADKRKEELSGYSKSEQSAAKILLARMQKLAKEHKCVRCGGDHKVSACKETKPKLERCAFLLGRGFSRAFS